MITTVEQIDRELLYNSSDPVYVGNVPVYPVTIRDIRRMGYGMYRTRLGLLCISEDTIQEMMQTKGGTCVPLLFLLSLLEYKEDLREDILSSFEMVTHCRPQWDIHSLSLFFGTGSLTMDNFPTFQNIVRERNKYDLRTVDENPADERTRALLRKSRELEKRRAKAKGDEDGVTLADLISICAAKLGVHPDTIGDYDMYQLDDRLGRLKAFDDYDTGIAALLHGASKEDVDLRYWIGAGKGLFDE